MGCPSESTLTCALYHLSFEMGVLVAITLAENVSEMRYGLPGSLCWCSVRTTLCSGPALCYSTFPPFRSPSPLSQHSFGKKTRNTVTTHEERYLLDELRGFFEQKIHIQRVSRVESDICRGGHRNSVLFYSDFQPHHQLHSHVGIFRGG